MQAWLLPLLALVLVLVLVRLALLLLLLLLRPLLILLLCQLNLLVHSCPTAGATTTIGNMAGCRRCFSRRCCRRRSLSLEGLPRRQPHLAAAGGCQLEPAGSGAGGRRRSCCCTRGSSASRFWCRHRNAWQLW